MTTALIVYDPDPDLGPDPLDEAKRPRRIGEFLDLDRMDVIIIWREWDEAFVDGARTSMVTSGMWEHVSIETVMSALEIVEDLPE